MADGLEGGPAIDTPAGLVRLLTFPPHPDLCTKAGTFLAFKKKGKWVDAAKREGLAKTDGERLNLAAEAAYSACCVAWQTLTQNVASCVLADLIGEVCPVLGHFRDYKRSAALLDFDDLIFAARDLLRDHDDVRRALAGRFSKVLVDEFQDTDPLQTEIFWRLCGEPAEAGEASDWTSFVIRPGALFLVGDPKQAIYRFRGADVSAYVDARDAFIAQDEDSVLSISTNFRSCAPILTFVNERFEGPLSSDGQPGFTALDPFHADRGEALCIAALDVAVAGEDGKASAEQQRDHEAEAVAQMCARLIGSEMIFDRRTGAGRLCRPGDIALLAPTGSDLWRYEEALERYGIPVATQAGKGLFRRQEVQDLIALTRVLADRRDTLALGALLRGPLVGLTEEQLLDIIWALPRAEDAPDKLPRFDLGVDPAEGLDAKVETARDLERWAEMSPELRKSMGAIVYRDGDFLQTEARVSDQFHFSHVWISFARGEDPVLAQRFRDRLMSRMIERWPETLTVPIAQTGSLPHREDLIRTDTGYEIKPSRLARYLCGDAPGNAPELACD